MALRRLKDATDSSCNLKRTSSPADAHRVWREGLHPQPLVLSNMVCVPVTEMALCPLAGVFTLERQLARPPVSLQTSLWSPPGSTGPHGGRKAPRFHRGDITVPSVLATVTSQTAPTSQPFWTNYPKSQ